LAVYAMLKEFFGPPNSDANSKPSQWGYELKIPEAHARVRDLNRFSWVLDVYPELGLLENGKHIASQFVKFIETNSKSFEKSAKLSAKMSDFRLIQNPCKIYLDSADGLLSLAESAPDQKEREDLSRAAFFLYLSSFEGLLNVVYDLYLKPFLKDDRIRKDLIRANLDLKLRLAPVYCTCFSRDTINYQNDELQRYVAIVELRNDFIHANVSPLMTTAVVKEDGFTFFVQKRESNKFEIPKILAGLKVEHLKFVRQTISDMSDAIIGSMNHKVKHGFARAIRQEQMIVEAADGENVLRSSI
jgi:hypothetical protein